MSRLALLSLTALLAACGDKDDTGSDGATDSGTADTTDTTDNGADFDCPPPDDAACAEEYAFCGNLKVPEDFTGTTRSLALALYETIPPAGPPNATLAEIEAPDMVPGSCYTVVVQPMLEQGNYYLWANLYMEGGGSWVPVNDIDYTAASAEPLELTGSTMVFEDLTLTLASGW